MLAARRLLRHPRPEPPGRHAHHGGLHRLHRQLRGRNSGSADLQPLYGITRGAILEEREAEALAGYRGMGPVRVGNAAYLQTQNDVYGSVILAATHGFFDRRMIRSGDHALYAGPGASGRAGRPGVRPARRRSLGAADAGSGPHLFQRHVLGGLRPSGENRGRPESAGPSTQVARARRTVCTRSSLRVVGTRTSTASSPHSTAANWTPLCCSFTNWAFCRRPIRALWRRLTPIGRGLKRGDLLLRYAAPDDFGKPASAFLICAFWYVDALNAIGRRDEARRALRTRPGVAQPVRAVFGGCRCAVRRAVGQLPATFSMVGLINSATRLSKSWEDAF